MTDEVKGEEKSLNLIDFLLIIINWKRFILTSTAIAGVVAIILYFFVFDLIYLSTATVKSSGKSGGLFNALEQLTDLSSLDLTSAGKTKELSSYEEILTSRRCLEPLIVKYDLMNKEEYRYMEDAVFDFKKQKLLIEVDKVSESMSIGVYYKDRELAKEMTEFLIAELDKINIELSTTQARNNREFIENRYLQAKVDLAKSEDSLKSFQMIYGIAPDLQIKASAQSVFTLEAELKAEEVKLDVIKKILSSEQPEVKTQEAKVSSLKSKISEINSSTDLNEFLRLGNSPQIAMQFLRLQRDLEIQTKILTFLLPVYEQAKIEEKKETPTIIILDKPYVAERKTKPKRLTMVIASILGSFVVLSICCIMYETTYKRISKSFKERK